MSKVLRAVLLLIILTIFVIGLFVYSYGWWIDHEKMIQLGGTWSILSGAIFVIALILWVIWSDEK